MNRREEDYIKTIYSLTVEEDIDLIQVQLVADKLQVTIQTANEMIKKLVKQELVNYTPYKGVSLTEKGVKEAIRIVRAHRILELFLTETLKFNWSEVHEDAEKLEHAASEKVVDALYKFLKEPKTDPHGHPIPQAGVFYSLEGKKLFSLNKGEIFKIVRVNENEEMFVFLNKNNLKIGSEFVVLDKDLEKETMTIKGEKKYQISKSIAFNIFVEKTKI